MAKSKPIYTASTISPVKKLRDRVPQVKTIEERLAEAFEKDFDSTHSSSLIQFDYAWEAHAKTRQSRRTMGMQPARNPSRKKQLLSIKMRLPLREVINNG